MKQSARASATYTPLRIFRCPISSACNGLSAQGSNASGYYWQVWTADGTVYLFGIDEPSEKHYSTNGCRINDFQTEVVSPTKATQAWFLRRLYAARRDNRSDKWSAQYDYMKTDKVDGPYPLPIVCGWYQYDPEVRLTKVSYGNSQRPAWTPNQYELLVDYITPTTNLNLRQPTTVTVVVSGNLQSRYVLGYISEKLQYVRREVLSGTTALKLPETVFEYESPLSGDLLSTVHNGYGGRQEFSYESDPTKAAYHRVLTRTLRDGAGWVGVTSYTYNGPCFNQAGSPCYMGHDGGIPSQGLIGHTQVTETAYISPAIATVGSIATHLFHTDTKRSGLVFDSRVLDPNISATPTNTLQVVQTSYRVFITDAGLVTGTWFAAPVTVTTYPRGDNPANASFYKRVENSYDPALQGGAFYGQVTGIKEYDSGALLRATSTRYAMNTTNWVLKPLSQTVTGPGLARASEVRYYYDDLAHGNVMTGNLTFAQEVVVLTTTDRTRDVAIRYDALGNRVQETLFIDYGSLGSTDTANRLGQVHRYGIDPVFGAYIISYTNPLAHTTRYEYYGVDGVGLQDNWGASFGLAKRVIPPAGDTSSTTYRYDVHGRLTAVIQPGDTITYPTTAYQYTDNYMGGGLHGLRVIESKRDQSSTNNTQPAIYFYDGLGRLVQTRVETIDGEQQAVTSQVYDPLGRVSMTSVPTHANFSSFAPPAFWEYEAPNWDTITKTTTHYDALGRAVRVANPDGTGVGSAYIEGANVSTVDANGHYRRELPDAEGRLKRAVESLAGFEDVFATLNPTHWTASPYQSIERQGVNDVLRSDASSPLLDQAAITRTLYAISGSSAINTGALKGVAFEFKVSATDGGARFMLEAQGTPRKYIALAVTGGKIMLQTSTDGVNEQGYELISAAKPDTWYVAVLRVSTYADGSSGWSYAEVWERDNPSLQGGLAYPNAAFAYARYRFVHTVHAGTAWLDKYQELSFWQTTYSYDALGNLTRVADPLGNTAVITYDQMGRKTSMTDPDMGTWGYAYDPAGNLISQTDAAGQSITLTYDMLNRVTGRWAATGLLAQYGYDSQADSLYGIGRRTSMSNVDASTRWVYDMRGRVVHEVYTVTGASTYATAYEYDARNRVVAMTYPTGEVVTTTYDAGGRPTKMAGIIGSTTSYVNAATYNALGLPARIDFGNGVQAHHVYYGPDYQTWGDPQRSYGLLRQLCVTAPGATFNNCSLATYTDTQALLNLAYVYDNAGNLTVLRDNTNGQRQALAYDALDRLVASMPSQSFGLVSMIDEYTETFGYDSLGNIVSRDGLTHTYSALKPHAVLRVTGATLTATRMITVVAKGDYAGGAWPTAMLYVNGVHQNTWDVTSASYRSYTFSVSVTDRDEVAVIFLNDYYGGGQDRNLYVDYVQVGSNKVQAEHGAFFDRGSTAAEALDGQRILAGAELMQMNGALRFAVGPGSFAAGYDNNGNMKARVEDGRAYWQEWDAENRLVTVTGAFNGQATHFFYDATGNRVKRVDVTGTLVTVGPHFDQLRVGTAVTNTSYYFLGAQRVAMRVTNAGTQATAIYWLHSDHLGSASLTTSDNGTPLSELRYYAFGQTRWASGETPTDRQFTGQRLEGGSAGFMISGHVSTRPA